MHLFEVGAVYEAMLSATLLLGFLSFDTYRRRCAAKANARG